MSLHRPALALLVGSLLLAGCGATPRSPLQAGKPAATVAAQKVDDAARERMAQKLIAQSEKLRWAFSSDAQEKLALFRALAGTRTDSAAAHLMAECGKLRGAFADERAYKDETLTAIATLASHEKPGMSAAGRDRLTVDLIAESNKLRWAFSDEAALRVSVCRALATTRTNDALDHLLELHEKLSSAFSNEAALKRYLLELMTWMNDNPLAEERLGMPPTPPRLTAPTPPRD